MSDNFREAFPEAKDSSDEGVLEELKQEALVVLKKCLQGKKAKYTQVEAARMVANSLFKKEDQAGTLHIHLTYKEIEKAKERAGLGLTKMLIPVKKIS